MHRPIIAGTAASMAADVVTASLDGGYLRIYDGIKPDDVETEITDQTQLAELRFNDPAFMTAQDGAALSYAISRDDDADATGTPTWFRAYAADGSTAVMDGTVGQTDTDLTIPSTMIVQHSVVRANQMRYTQSKG